MQMPKTARDSRFVAYYRVSTARQGRSGLGLEAQQRAVREHLNGGDWKLLAELTEVESGKRADRPKLAEALTACRLHGATLVIAKIDRLARDAHFLLGLEKAGINFVACDMPTANRLTVGIMAMVAEEERRMISKRTIEALASAKARGVRLGGFRGRAGPAEDCAKARIAKTMKAAARAADLAPVIKDIRAGGATSLRAIARELDDRGITAPRGGMWSASQVRAARLLDRLQ